MVAIQAFEVEMFLLKESQHPSPDLNRGRTLTTTMESQQRSDSTTMEFQKFRDGNQQRRNNSSTSRDRKEKSPRLRSEASTKARTSFASFKEERLAIKQSFVDLKTSSYARKSNSSSIASEAGDEAVIDDIGEGATNSKFINGPTTLFPIYNRYNLPTIQDFNNPTSSYSNCHNMGPLTHPSSTLHSAICPCSSFKGWKAISVKGKKASRSFDDLAALNKGFAWDDAIPEQQVDPRHAPRMSPFESIPMELLSQIIDSLTTDIPPNGFTPRNQDLMSLLLTSRTIHSATLSTLYHTITIPHSQVFRKFLQHVTHHPALGTMVRRLDFSHFNPRGTGNTGLERKETMNLTKDTLLQCLKLVPNLQEFLVQEHVDEDLSVEVLQHVFMAPKMQALDFCAASSAKFYDAMKAVFHDSETFSLPQTLSVTRLSFHGCTILPSLVFDALLPKLPKLTHLDVTHTRITIEALLSIPDTARLTHLNISKCAALRGEDVVDFLATHPAVKDTLVYLNLMTDSKTYQMLSAENISELLPILPSTLRSLNLKGSKMASEHITMLIPLTKHLEELSLGRGLETEDVSKLVLPPVVAKETKSKSSLTTSKDQLHAPHGTYLYFHAETDCKPTLEVKVCTSWVPHTLKYLDISDLSPTQLPPASLLNLKTSILQLSTLPLEVLEVSEPMQKLLTQPARELACGNFGWVMRDAGRRGWLVRIGVSGDGRSHVTMDIKKKAGIRLTELSKIHGVKNSTDTEEDGTRKLMWNQDDGSRNWKMGATYWGMRKVPVATQDVGGMYGLYMFKR